jgi:hypothetical protein
MENMDKELGIKIADFSRRVASAFSEAIPLDFYSRDGSTWDGDADGASEFSVQSDKYQGLLSAEAQKAENKTSKLSDLSEQLQRFIKRVEARVLSVKMIPMERTHRTVFDINTKNIDGSSGKTSLDLKDMTYEELLGVSSILPEARKEILFRTISGATEDSKRNWHR